MQKTLSTLINMLGRILPENQLGARYLRGAVWSFIGMGISYGSMMAANIVTARIIGKESYGALGIINSTVAMLGEVAGLGLGLTATKHVAAWRASEPDRAGAVIGFTQTMATVSGILLCLVLLIFAPQIASKALNSPDLSTPLRISCLLLLVNTLNGVQVGSLFGLEAFKTIAKTNLMKGVVTFPLLIAGAHFLGLSGAIAALVGVGMVGWAINRVALHKEADRSGVMISYSRKNREMSSVWMFAIPAFLAGIVVTPAQWIANTILVHQHGGYGEMGLLNASSQWRAALMFLPTVALQVALPLMSSALGCDEEDDYATVLEITQSLTIAVVFPVAAALMFAASWIMSLYGGSFASGQMVFIYVLAGVMISSVGCATGSAIQSKGRMWLGFAINAIWGMGLVLFTSMFVGRWAGTGVAFSASLSYLIITVYTFIALSRELPRAMIRRAYISMAYLSLLTIICVLTPQISRVYLALPACVLTLFATLYFFTSPKLRKALFQILTGQGNRIDIPVDENETAVI